LPALRHPFIKELVSRCASSIALSATHAKAFASDVVL